MLQGGRDHWICQLSDRREIIEDCRRTIAFHFRFKRHIFSLGLTAVRVGFRLCIRVRRLEAANQANGLCVTVVRIDVALCHRASIAG